MALLPIPPILDTARFRQLNLKLLNQIANQGGGLLGSVAVSNFPATQPISGSVSVSNFPATQAVSGSVGVSGNVEITNDSGNPIPVSGVINSDTSGNGSVTASTPFVVSCFNNSTLAFSANGGATGTVTIEGTIDGTNWLATSYVSLTSGGISSGFNAATQTIGQINTTGLLSIRFRSNTIVGTVPIYYITSRNVYNVALDHPLPAGTNIIGGAYATPNASAGTSLNQGSTGYTTSGGTLAAATRKYLLIQNTGTTNALYVTTDGTTPTATNGFTLAASGGGIVFDGSFVPNGDVKLASTSTNFSILWA